MIEHLIDRARLLNAHDHWEYRVRILVVFGSYIRDVERPITPAGSWICRVLRELARFARAELRGHKSGRWAVDPYETTVPDRPQIDHDMMHRAGPAANRSKEISLPSITSIALSSVQQARNFKMINATLSEKLSAHLRDLFENEEKIRGGQQAVESICFTILALRHDRRTSAFELAIRKLETSQNRDGSWPAFVRDEPHGCWTTALAALTLLATGRSAERIRRATHWLLRAEGREANWFWRWKFQTLDNSVRFDPAKYGWSWVSNTTSWVIPTSFSLIALQHLRAAGVSQDPRVNERITLGTSLLLDRMCPGGGWNAGNGVAFGVAYAPYIDATSIALLSLRQRHPETWVQASLLWLASRLPECSSSYSLAWGLLALVAYRRESVEALNALTRAINTMLSEMRNDTSAPDISTLAICALALEAADGDNVFEVGA